MIFNAVRSKITSIDSVEYNNNVYFGNTIAKDLKSKNVRSYIIEKEVPDIKNVVNRTWVKKYGLIATEENTWLIARKCTKEVRLQLLHWKILHHIYPTRILLKKMKITNDEYCTECNVIETIEHFYFHCKIVRKLWEKVQSDLHHKKVISEQDCILGNLCCNEDNLFILIAKVCISKFKYGEYKNLLILYENEKKERIQMNNQMKL